MNGKPNHTVRSRSVFCIFRNNTSYSEWDCFTFQHPKAIILHNVYLHSQRYVLLQVLYLIVESFDLNRLDSTVMGKVKLCNKYQLNGYSITANSVCNGYIVIFSTQCIHCVHQETVLPKLSKVTTTSIEWCIYKISHCRYKVTDALELC